MNAQQKGIIINGIINTLNEQLKKKNQELVKKTNSYILQEPLHGADMFFKLAFLEDEEIKEIAKACGL